MSEDHPQIALRHPLYLDVPMMTSYLAYLTGGVAYSYEHKSRNIYRDANDKGIEAGLNLPAGALARVNFTGHLAHSKADEASNETNIERHHTAASLFNVLLDYLTDEAMIDSLTDRGTENHHVAALIRADGQFIGNPLEDLLGLLKQLIPYMRTANAAPEPPGNPRSGNPAKRNATNSKSPQDVAARQKAEEDQRNTDIGLNMFETMYQDIQQNSVADMLMRTENGTNVVVTAAREFLTPQAAAQLKASSASVVGKVSGISSSEPVSLLRRTVFTMADANERLEMFSDMPYIGDRPAENLEIEPPVVQVIPLAIFV